MEKCDDKMMMDFGREMKKNTNLCIIHKKNKMIRKFIAYVKHDLVCDDIESNSSASASTPSSTPNGE